MSEVILLLGGNLENREEMLSGAILRIAGRIGKITCRSSVYETAPWGFRSKQPFLNQVIKVTTALSPEDVLTEIHLIEEELGRTRHSRKYSSRNIDIDILLYDHLTINLKRLQIPHPRMLHRKFTMIPLAEIASDLIHPLADKSIGKLAEECKDKHEVKIYQPVTMKKVAIDAI